MPSIPIDVYVLILECVYRLSQSHKLDYQTLFTSSLVCRAWTPLAQRFLFRRIPSFILSGMPNRSWYVSIPRLTSIIRGYPLLGTYVRSLTVGGQLEINRPDPLFLDNVITFLALCPNIASLRILTPLDTLAWSPAAEERLRALNLQPTFLELEDDSAGVYTLLELWPSIRSLRAPWGPSHAYTLMSDRPVSLDSVETYGSVGPEFMEWLLTFGNSGSTLREVDIQLPTWADQRLAKRVATAAPPSIRSLTTEDAPPPGVLDRFERLNELIIGRLPDAMPALPRSLRHVGYHQTYPGVQPDNDRLQSFMAALSAARELQMVSATRHSSEEVLAALEKTCRTHDLEWIIYPDPASFPRARNVDWI